MTAAFAIRAVDTLDYWQKDAQLCKELIPQAVRMCDAYKEAIEALRGMCREINKTGSIAPDWAKEVLEKYPEDIWT